jgi:hypothetical protein
METAIRSYTKQTVIHTKHGRVLNKAISQQIINWSSPASQDVKWPLEEELMIKQCSHLAHSSLMLNGIKHPAHGPWSINNAVYRSAASRVSSWTPAAPPPPNKCSPRHSRCRINMLSQLSVYLQAQNTHIRTILGFHTVTHFSDNISSLTLANYGKSIKQSPTWEANSRSH